MTPSPTIKSSNILDGGSGNDSLTSRSLSGDHTLLGGTGNDTLNATGLSSSLQREEMTLNRPQMLAAVINTFKAEMQSPKVAVEMTIYGPSTTPPPNYMAALAMMTSPLSPAM